MDGDRKEVSRLTTTVLEINQGWGNIEEGSQSHVLSLLLFTAKLEALLATIGGMAFAFYREERE